MGKGDLQGKGDKVVLVVKGVKGDDAKEPPRMKGNGGPFPLHMLKFGRVRFHSFLTGWSGRTIPLRLHPLTA
jgi:hypothetical protein